MNGFNLFQKHKKAFFDKGAFSVYCALSNGIDEQGRGAILPLDDPNYNKEDALKCISSFIGLSVSTETGLGIIGDSAQATINSDSITIGRPIEDWKLDIKNPLDGEIYNFKIKNVMQDRTAGLYLMDLSIIKPDGEGKRIYRRGVGGL